MLFKLILLGAIFLTSTPGKFTYKAQHFSESLELLENNLFKYEATLHMGVRLKVQGSYRISKDSIYLNSLPRLDRLIVKESSNAKHRSKTYFNIRTKENDLINYHLYITFEDDEVKILRDQFKQTVVSQKKIKEFYIIDTKGLKSPVYKIQHKHANVFDIQFETNRVFENESWAIRGDSIIPKGFDGQIQNYALTKNL